MGLQTTGLGNRIGWTTRSKTGRDKGPWISVHQRLPLQWIPQIPLSSPFLGESDPLPARAVIRNGQSPGDICVAELGCPIIMKGDGFVLTRHELLEGLADLSKFLAF